jgi:DNA-binding CsgD family transcriptional regulator
MVSGSARLQHLRVLRGWRSLRSSAGAKTCIGLIRRLNAIATRCWLGMTLANLEALRAVLIGLGDQELAVERQRSASAVADPLASLFGKLDVTSRLEVAALALSFDSVLVFSTSPGARGGRSSLATVRARWPSAED